MEAHISHTYTSYVLDPQVYGLDGSIWKTVSGTPTVTSSKYRLNAAEIITYSQFRFGEIEFNVTVPAAPTASDNRRFGLSGKALGNRGLIAFEIGTAGELRARVRDKFGNSLFNELIPWQSAWTNTATLFRIGWTRNSVVFTVTLTDGTTPWTTTYIAGVNPLSLPMGIDVLNGNSDNMDVTSVMVAHSNTSSPLGVNVGSGAAASQVQGNVASGATDAGNPVKTGGVYNTTQPTLTNGQRGDTQMDVRANTLVSQGTLISGVMRGGPADRAGIRPGDVLLDVAGHAVNDPQSMLEAVAALPPGNRAPLQIRRGREKVDVQVEIGRRPALARSE